VAISADQFALLDFFQDTSFRGSPDVTSDAEFLITKMIKVHNTRRVTYLTISARLTLLEHPEPIGAGVIELLGSFNELLGISLVGRFYSRRLTRFTSCLSSAFGSALKGVLINRFDLSACATFLFHNSYIQE
jgi:hypothetical protein